MTVRMSVASAIVDVLAQVALGREGLGQPDHARPAAVLDRGDGGDGIGIDGRQREQGAGEVRQAARTSAPRPVAIRAGWPSRRAVATRRPGPRTRPRRAGIGRVRRRAPPASRTSRYTVERETPAWRATSSTRSAPRGPRSRDARAASRIRCRVASDDSARFDCTYRRLSMSPWYFIGHSVRHRTPRPMKTTDARSDTDARHRSPTRPAVFHRRPRAGRRGRTGRPGHRHPARPPGRSPARHRAPRDHVDLPAGDRPSAPARWRSSAASASTTPSARAAGG